MERAPPNNNMRRKSSEESPTKLRPLVPKSLFTKSVEYVPLPKIGKIKEKKKNVIRSILPKPYIHGTRGSSPTKAAALMLKKKATLVCQRMSPVKILPKRPYIESLPVLPTLSRVLTRSQGNKESDLQSVDINPTQDGNQVSHAQPESSGPIAETEKGLQCNSQSANIPQEEDCEFTVKDEDQMQLDDLMAACTTIRYDPKKSSSTTGQDGDTKSKSQKRRQICLSMLEKDILEADPKKDERDTEYAKDYFNRVKHALQFEPDRFKQFLTKLHDMNKENGNPVKLYADISSLLHDHQELVDDFASFLLAHQAVECGCFIPYFQYQQLREFFRKLEIYCDNSPTLFQRTLKLLSKWLTPTQEGQSEAVPFKEKFSTVLKNVPGILDELLHYYLDGQPPDSFSLSDDFEDVNLEAVGRVSGFEELTLPAGTETYNTKMCGCTCHDDHSDEKFQKRLKHCISCSLKQLDNGIPILKTSKYEYQQLTIIYPQKEKEKLKKAKREAAQLALAKAKAQKSYNKKNKTKGTSHNTKSKHLSIKRKQRRKISKSRKEGIRCFVKKIRSDDKADRFAKDASLHHAKTSVTKTNSEDVNLQTESNSIRSHVETQGTSVARKVQSEEAMIISVNQKI